ncbi:MAG: hypothetical protein K6U80_19985 [Firmicutes bacterium]|nr:hypothetical protein [Bacillota bacterium]
MKIICYIIIILLILLVTGCLISFNEPILDSFEQEYSKSGLNILTPLEIWEKQFGSASVIPQKDGGHTYFYWPKKGIAVFTHPHYEAQYRRKERSKRKVTSIIIPLKKTIKPRIVPVEDDLIISFDQLTNLEINGHRITNMSLSEIKNLYRFTKKSDNFIEMSNFPIISLAPILTTVYIDNNEPTQIEIEINRLFDWYD